MLEGWFKPCVSEAAARLTEFLTPPPYTHRPTDVAGCVYRRGNDRLSLDWLETTHEAKADFGIFAG